MLKLQLQTVADCCGGLDGKVSWNLTPTPLTLLAGFGLVSGGSGIGFPLTLSV